MREGITFEALAARHRLRLDVNALCELEEAWGCTINDIGPRLAPADGKVALRDLRTAFRCALGDDVTDRQAGDIMAEIGMERAGDLLGQAVALAFGAGEAAGAEGTPGKRKAAA